MARKNKNSQSFYLCAYLISSYAIKPMELKEYLSAPLPDYMVPPYFIIMDKFPLTPNGKINRRALPNPEDIEIDGHAEYGAPRDEIEEILVKIWKQILGRDNIGINDNFFLIGGDSIKTIQMISRMKKNGYIVNMRDIFQRPTISQLSPFIRKSHRIPDQTQIMGEFPLTPIQKTFLDIWGIHSHHYNQAVMFYSRTRLEPDGVRAVFKKIQEHHDILRVTYKKDQTGGVLQFNHGLDFPLSLEVYDLTAESRKKANEILSVRADQIQASIDLENGPLLKLGLFHLDDGDRLLIVIHHLIVDGVSWRILFEDIENLYRQYLQYKDNVTFELPLKSDSFKLWAERLNNYACNESFLEEASYWAQIEAAEIRPFKKDSEGSNAYNDAARSTIQLEQEDTNRLLLEVNKAFGTDLKDILLTSFGLAVKETFDIDKMLIALEGHGREDIFSDIDISRTIGWFTTEYPIILNVSYETDEDCIINNKEYLRQIPNKGIGYGILKYLTPPVHKQNINFRLRPEISFNFLGQFDSDARQMSFFTMAKESPGNMQSPYADREFQLQVSGAIAHNQLTMALTYSKNQYKTNTISRLMENFKSCLIRLINFCASRKETRRTPSDFTYKKLSLKTLEQLEARYSLEDIYSLSHMQEGMLFHALYDIKSSAYFEQVSYRLIWELEPVIVVKSLNRLFERYDILRTVFIYEDIERPIQLVLKNRQVEFFYKDLIDEPNSKNKDAYIKAFKEKDRQRSFDLSRDILMRVAVIRISLSEYEFIWSHHHILMDGWCTSILITEFFEIYKNYQEGKTCLLPDVKPYRVYIQWLEKQDRKKSKNYWAAYLDGYEQLNGIPLAQIREKNVNEKYCGHAEILLIEKNYSEKLARIAAAANVTLNTVIQALWGILIGKYNNSTDVVFGAVVSGRPSEIPGIERMIGLFINTVPIRIRWEEKNVFKYLIRKIQDEAIENESHHYYSLADIQAASFLKQDLLDHILIFENLPIAEQIEGLAERSPKNSTRSLWKLSNIESFEQTNYNFNLTIIAGEQLALKFEYNALIYQQEDVQQLAQCFNSLVMQITAHEEMQIRELTLISEKEKECILYEFNPVDGDKAYHKTFLMLFQEQVARVPNNVALVGRSITAKSGLNEVQCTYSVLDIAAGRLALLLREKGIRPGIIAGIMLNRCIELIVSLLAVLKSGGAYVPIDPAYPADRIRYMLDYSGIPLLISINGLVRNIPFHREVIDLQNAKMLNVNNDLQEEITFMDLAYIIFTSGSTGNPKGVMVQHDQYVNTALAWRREYRLDEIEINLLQMAAFSFDVFAGDVARALGNGGKLIICPEETRTDYISLHRLIVTHRITIFEATPALTIPFMDYIYENNMELCHLKLLIVGSDTCYVEDFKRLLSRFGSRMRIVNSYGVTEATIDTSYFEGNLNSLPTAGNVPIGKPLPKMKIYILDFWGNLLPAGITGELYIGGDSVARGYLNQPQLTAQHFFPDPFFPGKRIYKTGDRAKWLKDGNIQFLGRFDYQVKIRGYRIELGEIENQLLGHPNIEKAIVITTGNLLAAYIVFDIPLDIFQLRDYLSRHLPTFMMPTHIIPIKEMPLSPNGKIDRKALPPPVLDGNDYGYIPPRYDKEKTMAHIWAEVLGLNPGKISIESNFFQIGGHSLNAVVLASKIHKEFNIRIPVAQIFNSPTITEMLAFLAKSDPDMFDPIEPAEKRDYYPFSASQKRIYFVDMMRQDLSYNMPSILLAEGFIDLEKLENAFKCFVQRHESCRTSFHVMNGTYIQRVYDAVPFEIEYYEASNQTEADRLVNHFIRRFELNRVPLFRGGVIRLEKEKHIVMIDMHHIISDQVSDNIFKKEILAFYTGQQLPSLKIQYKDYALWQNSPKKQQAIEKQKKFWLNHLKGEIPKVNLPLDYPRPRIQLYEALNVSFEISPGETEALRQLLLEKRGTIFIGLLTVFNILLAKISAQDDIIVGTGLAGRQHTDLQNVVGYFVNTLVLRNNLSANKTLSSILEEVKENTIQAFENQEYEFEDLLQQFRSQQGSERSHLFDVFLTLETLPINVTGETSLTSSEDILFKLRPYKYDTPTAKADLALIGVDDGKKLSLVFRYCTSLFKEDTIQKFVRYFKIILTSLIENPQCKIIELELLSKEEKNKALEQVKKDREIIQTEFDLD
ncbi:MAG: amino acid adenylation domain-containing protein [Acidobacteria bacterium]|nr:amino acid adenylation domain-containing protein [Acidobacteriota bacterium]